jgi:dienelactone hydrolase
MLPAMKTRSLVAILSSLLALTGLSRAATTPAAPTRADRMLADYFRAETAQLSARGLAEIRSLDDWTARRERCRQQLADMLGLWPPPPRTDLRPVVTGKVEHDQFRVENLHFQSLPGLYVTANLYVPKALSKPAPTILYLCGHGPVISNNVSYGNKVSYQHHGAWFARQGYVCLIIDTVQLGEIPGLHHGTHREGLWWWNARGYTPAGVEAWNSLRALDYLATRPEVDTNRFGVTGRSGGGAYSWWAAALDDRIKVAAPVAGITDLRNHVVDGAVEGHCDCMFLVNTYRWDYPQVAALVAPRPLLLVNTDSDTIFPLDGVLRTHAHLRSIYRLFNASNQLGLVIGPGPHKDTQDLQVPVLRWFNRHLKGEDPAIELAATKLFTPQQLKVFDRLPAEAINTNIHHTFVPSARSPAVPPSAEAWPRQRDAWLAALKEKTFAGWPEDAGPLEVERRFEVERGGLRFQAFDFTSQPHVRLRLYALLAVRRPERIVLNLVGDRTRPNDVSPLPRGEGQSEGGRAARNPATSGSGIDSRNPNPDAPAASAASPFAPRTSDLEAVPDWRGLLGTLRVGFGNELAEELEALAAAPAADTNAFRALRQQLETNRAAFVWFAPRGLGLDAWSGDARKQTQLRRRFMLLGQTLDGMRVWDIRRALQAARSIAEWRAPRLSVQAESDLACNALYASLFEPGLAGLDLWRLPASHQAGPDYLNVLRLLDVPQAVAMAAERCPVRAH